MSTNFQEQVFDLSHSKLIIEDIKLMLININNEHVCEKIILNCETRRQKLLVIFSYVIFTSCQISNIVNDSKEKIQIENTERERDSEYNHTITSHVIIFMQKIMHDYYKTCVLDDEIEYEYFKTYVADAEKNCIDNSLLEDEMNIINYFENVPRPSYDKYDVLFNIDNYNLYSSRGIIFSAWPIHKILHGEITDDFLRRFV